MHASSHPRAMSGASRPCPPEDVLHCLHAGAEALALFARLGDWGQVSGAWSGCHADTAALERSARLAMTFCPTLHRASRQEAKTVAGEYAKLLLQRQAFEDNAGPVSYDQYPPVPGQPRYDVLWVTAGARNHLTIWRLDHGVTPDDALCSHPLVVGHRPGGEGRTFMAWSLYTSIAEMLSSPFLSRLFSPRPLPASPWPPHPEAPRLPPGGS